MKAKTTAEVFYQNYIVHYGMPQKINSDQVANVEVIELFKNVQFSV